MKILYISQYFNPEIGATSNRTYSNAKYFSEKGHKVVILTEMPNRTKGKIFYDYKGKLFCYEKMNGFDVLRAWVYATPNRNFMTRLFTYFSFTITGLILAITNWKRYDIVYVTSPPLPVGIIGIILKHLFQDTKFIFEVRDLWPETAIVLNELRNKLLIKISRLLEEKCYSISDKIFVISNYIKNEIIKKGIYRNKILVIMNGTDTNFFFKINNLEFKTQIGLKSKFVVVYAGILGLAQKLETLLNAAKELKNQKDIIFLIIGDGPEKLKLKIIAENSHLNNCKFIDEIPTSKIHKYLSIGDCGIVPLRKIKIFNGAIPSKLFDYMACELPVLLGVDGEAREILQRSKGGIFYDPENVNDLIDKILWLKDNPEKREKMSKWGRKFVEHFFDRRKIAEKIGNIIFELTQHNN
ncbi:MAG: glycosyltransferase family 4 protein [Candidatus Cloacimonetes bacterium]|nr:glycosyltransferase family 4 protein [Candidatus Cloacimonadota bacterium]